MWLLNASTLALDYFEGDNLPQYDILSHRWEREEILFSDIQAEERTAKKGWRKVLFCCQQAIREVTIRQSQAHKSEKLNQPAYVWIDTCCIDKSNSAELSEAINRMYEWYAKARKCYAYMGDVDRDNRSSFESSAWFTRCWTLQELLAPKEVEFYDHDWQLLGDRASLSDEITNITGIPDSALLHFEPRAYSVAEKMSWAADRQSTRREDAAYSLLGLFGVHMPMIYGEGMQAFQRLQEEILKRSEDLTIFAWSRLNEKDLNSRPGILAYSPTFYRREDVRYEIFRTRTDFSRLRFNDQLQEQAQGISLTSSGICMDLFLIPYNPDRYLAVIGYRSILTEPSKLPGPSSKDQYVGAKMLAQGRAVSEVVCMLIRRFSLAGGYRRVALDGQCTFLVPQAWISRGRFRRVNLINERLLRLSIMGPPSGRWYGFVVEKISIGKAYDRGIQLFSRIDPCQAKRNLVMEYGDFGIAGAIRLEVPPPTMILMFGFDFDFNPFCLTITPDQPFSKRCSLETMFVSVSCLGIHKLSLGSNVEIMKMVTRIQKNTGSKLSLKHDRVELFVGSWRDSECRFLVDNSKTVLMSKSLLGDDARKLTQISILAPGTHDDDLEVTACAPSTVESHHWSAQDW